MTRLRGSGGSVLWSADPAFGSAGRAARFAAGPGAALYPKTVLKSAVRTMLVPVPKTAAIAGQPLRDTELLTWCGEVIRLVLADL